jgi:hypothetical protein
MNFSDISKLVTIITPLKLIPGKIDFFTRTLNSYYNGMPKPIPKHLIALDTNKTNFDIGEYILNSFGCNYLLLPSGSNNGLVIMQELISSVETPYFLMLLDDVMLLKDIDFLLNASISAMTEDDNLIQVKFGGGVLSSFKNNKECFITNKSRVRLISNKNSWLKRMVIKKGNATVWTLPLKSELANSDYPLSYYNCLMKTSIFKRINNVVAGIKNGYTKGDISDYLCLVNRSRNNGNKLVKFGWPKGLLFLNKYKTGFINLASYIYCFSREKVSVEEYIKRYCNAYY